MKRELVFGANRSSYIETESQQVARDNGENYNNCKRFKVPGKVNGYFVYSRARKSKKVAEFDQTISPSSNNISLDELQLCRKINGSSDSLDGETVTEENQSAEKVIKEEPSLCIVELPNCKIEPMMSETSSILGLAKECGDIGEGKKKLGREGKCNRNKNKMKRLTKRLSNLNFKLHPVEVKVSGLEAIDSGMFSKVEVEMIAEGSALTPPKKNLELKMSKKIALDNVPMTVKELFETGLLEGVPVVYMGGKKFQAFCLRGTIKDVGILCSCSFCKGICVIPPSQFEIHAIRQYRRASQYICFENGKSLLDVLNACRNSPLDSLEATIRSAISGSPVEKTFTCRRCKGPLCNSCVESKEIIVSSACESAKASLVEPVFSAESSGSASVSTLSQDNTQKKKTIKSSKSDLKAKAPIRTSSRRRSRCMIIPKSPEALSVIQASKSAPAHLYSRKRKQWKITSRSPKTAMMSKSLKNASDGVSSENKFELKITTKDQRLHKLVFDDGGLPDGTEVAYYARGQKFLMGYKRGCGILCCCCNCEVSPSIFEAHAGWATRRKPYAYIYTSNGVSLHELAISLSKGRKYSARDNDDLCVVCADGGSLLLCDGCPRAFHQGCASLSSVPRGKWFCQFCQNMFQKDKSEEHNVNAVAAGRISGVDSIEQITQRCIRIVKNIEAELTGCVLCRGYDFSRSGFGPRTIILCDQCEKEFHVGCLRSHKIANLKELPRGKWFCCSDCGKIHSALKKLLAHEAEIIPHNLLEIVKKKNEDRGLETMNNIDVRWKLLTGKSSSPETKLLLSQALAIFEECFDPIVDTTGRDLIPLMVYGKNSKGQDYGGMYCAVLIVDSFVVSAAIVRVFGQEVAELPLVATKKCNHGKGYFQLLFSFMEKLLSYLKVQSIVLPSAEEAEAIWTDKFGFQKIKPDQLSKYRKSCCQIMSFKGTSMLQKVVPPCRIINQTTESILGIL
ncbi:uncharacterized protein LOC126676656 isoform X2 [Mercurialis annua]|uniref:uncharacterized protein LOC126676656 isoform X2 n=1 Tax=Mercurialis annua TaxID=3986 RepID=UPI00216003C5|nr:uncharacterized protein LOC126676656 isoform X2 [Mercurialis annua]